MAAVHKAVFSLSFPKLAERFGNERQREANAASAVPATSNINAVVPVRIFIDLPSLTILALCAKVENPVSAKYNLVRRLLAPAGAWYKKIPPGASIPRKYLGPLSEQRRFEWLT